METRSLTAHDLGRGRGTEVKTKNKTHYLYPNKPVCEHGKLPRTKQAKYGTTDPDAVTCVACRKVGKLGKRMHA
jgi:hypothetical protein